MNPSPRSREKFNRGWMFHRGDVEFRPDEFVNGGMRASAARFTDEFRDCVTLMAQYTYDTFGKFPATVPSIAALPYLQAHHLDLEFYDHYFKPGAYLETHARHMERWHEPESVIQAGAGEQLNS